MSLAAVIRALHGAGIQPTGLEIAEALWIAQYMAIPAPAAAAPLQPPQDKDDGQATEPTSAVSSAPTVPLSTATATVGGLQARGYPVGIPDLPGVQRRGDIVRALRSLRRYGPSPRHRVIDEDATAAFIANTGLRLPVTRPAPERWFDVVLAVDCSPSMELWRPLVSDLRTLLTETGAFRDVRTWRLRPQQDTVFPSGPAGAEGAARSPRELIDSSGRRLFLVVTDGAAHGWHDGSAAQVLSDWGRTGPVAVVQPLPEEMWARTGLPAVPARLSSRAPGVPNRQLRVVFRHRRRRISGIPVPVLGAEPGALHAWARLVMGAASAVPLAVTLTGSDQPPVPSPVSGSEPGSLIDGFRASASPHAYQLAVFLSAVHLDLPLMRLVQHAAVPGSGTSALAEVILGGLVIRTGDSTYEFLPGIREALFRRLRRSEMTKVLLIASDSITRRAGTAGQTFAAIAQLAEGPATADAAPFGWVSREVAVRLGMPDTLLQEPGDQSPAQMTSGDRQDSDTTQAPSPPGTAQQAPGLPGNAPVYVVSVAASLSGMHPETLRHYERIGLVVPTRNADGGRRYSMRDILTLREVQRLSQDEGVNLAGIKRILDLERENEQTRLLAAELRTKVDQLRDELGSVRGSAARLAELRRTGANRPSAVVPWYGQGDPEEARRLYQQAIETGHPDQVPSAMLNLGVLEYHLGNPDQAREWWRRAVVSGHPDEAPRAMLNLGILEYQQGNPDQARDWYQKAIVTGHPDEAPNAMLNLGILETAQGGADQARHWYQRAIAAGHPGAASQAQRALEALGRRGVRSSGGETRL